jgi:hypothetical protein
MKSALMQSAASRRRPARVITSSPGGQDRETQVRYLGDVSHLDHLLSARYLGAVIAAA